MHWIPISEDSILSYIISLGVQYDALDSNSEYSILSYIISLGLWYGALDSNL